MDTAAAAVWTDPDTPVFCLLALGLDRYLPAGKDADDQVSPINWSTDTWKAEIQDDCGIGPHPAVIHRLAAGLALLHSPDEFYTSLPGFHTLVEALAGEYFDPTTSHPLSAAEIAWACFQAAMVNPAGTFSPAVSSYVHHVCREEGYIGVPKPLKAMGITPDPTIPMGVNVTDDPDTATLVAQSAADLDADLDQWLKDRILDLSERLVRLPLHRADSRQIAAELRRHAS